MIIGFGVWVLYFIDTALLVVIHIPYTQKWARGFTEPSRYGGVHEHLQLYKRNNYIYVNVIIYVYICTPRWLYVVITTKHKNRRRDTQCLKLQRVHGYLQLYIQNNLCINTYTPPVAATSFFCGWGRNLWFRNRTRKKVYRRQEGKFLGKFWRCCIANMGVQIEFGFWGDILLVQRC